MPEAPSPQAADRAWAPPRLGRQSRAVWSALVLWALACVAMGLGAHRWVPPLQSPDEFHHLARAEALTHGHWRLWAPQGRASGAPVDRDLLDYIHAHLVLAGQPERRLSAQERAEVRQMRWSSGRARVFTEMPGTGYYLPLVYAPHALALTMGRQIGLSVHETYLLTRAAAQATSLALVTAALAILAPPVLVLALLALPMTLFQFAAPTIDGVSTGAAVLALSLWLRDARSASVADGGLGDASAWAVASLLALVVTCRAHLLPLLALPAWTAWQRRDRASLAAAVVAVTGALGWTALAATHTVDLRAGIGVPPADVALHYLRHPAALWDVMSNTLGSPETLSFYGRSFIGVLGWLDAGMEASDYRLLGAGLAALSALSAWQARGRGLRGQRTLLAGLALACVALVFVALLLTWTPHPATSVQGVQGRYFLVPALVLAYALGGAPPRCDARAWPSAVAYGAAATFLALSAWRLAAALATRYA